MGICDAAESIGFCTNGVRLTLSQLAEEAKLPCILHWNQSHFVVCYEVKETKSGFSLTTQIGEIERKKRENNVRS